MLNVLIADRNKVFAKGFANLLEAKFAECSQIDIFTARSKAEYWSYIPNVADLVFCDIDFFSLPRPETVAMVKKCLMDSRIIFLTREKLEGLPVLENVHYVEKINILARIHPFLDEPLWLN